MIKRTRTQFVVRWCSTWTPPGETRERSFNSLLSATEYYETETVMPDVMSIMLLKRTTTTIIEEEILQ